MPKRIQRKRTKGWRMPDNCVNVCRPTKWGNPYRVELGLTREQCVELFRVHVENNPELVAQAKAELGGKDLACFCSVDVSCHADVLLEIANSGEE